MGTARSGSLAGRMVRALQLDPALYREVAGPEGSTWQAAQVMLLAAVSNGLVAGAAVTAYVLERSSGWPYEGVHFETFRTTAAGIFWIRAIATTLAWPVWSAGLWLVSRRLTDPGEAPGIQQIARLIAFAQTPTILGYLIIFPIVVGGAVLGPEALFGLGLFYYALFASPASFAVVTWVLIGTFLAVRAGLGLSSGQALGSLAVVGVAIAALLGVTLVCATLIVIVTGVEPFYLSEDPWYSYAIDYQGDLASQIVAGGVVAAAQGLDFNLGFPLNLAVFHRIVDMFVGA